MQKTLLVSLCMLHKLAYAAKRGTQNPRIRGKQWAKIYQEIIKHKLDVEVVEYGYQTAKLEMITCNKKKREMKLSVILELGGVKIRTRLRPIKFNRLPGRFWIPPKTICKLRDSNVIDREPRFFYENMYDNHFAVISHEQESPQISKKDKTQVQTAWNLKVSDSVRAFKKFLKQFREDRTGFNEQEFLKRISFFGLHGQLFSQAKGADARLYYDIVESLAKSPKSWKFEQLEHKDISKLNLDDLLKCPDSNSEEEEECEESETDASANDGKPVQSHACGGTPSEHEPSKLTGKMKGNNHKNETENVSTSGPPGNMSRSQEHGTIPPPTGFSQQSEYCIPDYWWRLRETVKRYEKRYGKLPPAPFCCAHSDELMRDPVVLFSDVKNCYEREIIEKWFREKGKPLSDKDWIKNHTLKAAIDKYIQEQSKLLS